MLGRLFVYNSNKNLVAFETHYSSSPAAAVVILIPGISEGPLALPYVELLGKTLLELQAVLVQPILSSSYSGYGITSLDSDAEDLTCLIRYLKHHHQVEHVILIGHSTGCQDILWFLKHSPERQAVRTAILQAPVSDREFLNGEINATTAASLLEKAQALINEGKGHYLLPTEDVVGWYGAPVTAYRFHSLMVKCGDDDMFSTDLDESYIGSLYHHIPSSTRIYMVGSGKDEYVSSQQNWLAMASKHQSAHPGMSLRVLENASHALLDEQSQQEFCALIRTVLHSSFNCLS